MSLIEFAGDLLAVPDLEAVAFGVNCTGTLDLEHAPIRQVWPEMFVEYQHRVAARLLPLGGFVAWRIPPGGRFRRQGVRGEPAWRYQPKWLYGLAAQARPGAVADLGALQFALDNMLACARAARVNRIGMPRIGCGSLGLRWSQVRPLVEAAARYCDIVVAIKGTG